MFFQTPMPDANYAVVCTSRKDSSNQNGMILIFSMTSTYFQLETVNTDGNSVQTDIVNCIVTR